MEKIAIVVIVAVVLLMNWDNGVQTVKPIYQAKIAKGDDTTFATHTRRQGQQMAAHFVEWNQNYTPAKAGVHVFVVKDVWMGPITWAVYLDGTGPAANEFAATANDTELAAILDRLRFKKLTGFTFREQLAAFISSHKGAGTLTVSIFEANLEADAARGLASAAGDASVPVVNR